MNLAIHSERLLAELHHLALLTDCPATTDKSLPEPTQAVNLPFDVVGDRERQRRRQPVRQPGEVKQHDRGVGRDRRL